jgi:anti-anti-sigma factor
MALLRVEDLPDVTVATFTATSLDESNAEAVGQELSGLAARLGGHCLQLDLREVDFLTSTGLGKLIGLDRRVRAAGGRLTLRNLRPEVYEIFAVCRLTGVLDVRPADPDAEAPLSESA